VKVRKEPATEGTNEGANECKNQDSNKPTKNKSTTNQQTGAEIEFENRLRNFDGIELTVRTGVSWLKAFTYSSQALLMLARKRPDPSGETLVRWKAEG
jgi:hypothetical protein